MQNWRARYSLRGLMLAMAVVCCVAAGAGYEVSWIQQRQAFRNLPSFSFVESSQATSGLPSAPGLLWLFGEKGMAFVTMEVLEEDLDYSASGDRNLKGAARLNVLRAHALFPEAAIYAMDESGDVVENLSRYWLSPGESAQKN